MATLRDEAEAFAVTIERGFCDVGPLIAWADARIAEAEVPDLALCELSLARHAYPQDLIGILRRIPGTPDPREVDRLILVLLRDRLKSGDEHAEFVARTLYRLAMDGNISDPGLWELACGADDTLDLLSLGIIEGSRREVIDQLAEALAKATGECAPGMSDVS